MSTSRFDNQKTKDRLLHRLWERMLSFKLNAVHGGVMYLAAVTTAHATHSESQHL